MEYDDVQQFCHQSDQMQQLFLKLGMKVKVIIKDIWRESITFRSIEKNAAL